MSGEQERLPSAETAQSRSSSLLPVRLNRRLLLRLGRSCLGLATVAFVLRAWDLAVPAFETPVEIFLTGATLLFVGGYLVDTGRRGALVGNGR